MLTFLVWAMGMLMMVFFPLEGFFLAFMMDGILFVTLVYLVILAIRITS